MEVISRVSLTWAPTKNDAEKFLPYPAVPEKPNVVVIYSSSTPTSITTWPEDRKYSQPDDPEQHRLEDRICPTRWDSKMRLVWYPSDRNTLATDTRYPTEKNTPSNHTTSKFRRRATSRMLQYYGETRMTKLRSRPASVCHQSESSTLADRNLRDVNYSREEPPRITTTVGDVPSNKERHPFYPKIHIPIGNPRMYHGCSLATTDRTQKTSYFRPPIRKPSHPC